MLSLTNASEDLQMSQTYSTTGQSVSSHDAADRARETDTCEKSQPTTNISSTEKWLSLGGGALLSGLGLSRGKLGGLVLLGAGAGLIYRGLTGHCYCYDALGIDTSEHNLATAVPAQQGYRVERAVTINLPAHELYSQWRNLENLPNLMSHLKSVEMIDDRRSHWIAEGPMGAKIEWDAEIINERENELSAWRSLAGSQMETAGSVRFTPLPHDRGTSVNVNLKYNPPAGKLGAAVAKIFGSGMEQQIADDLSRFKSQMEAGEAPTTQGQLREPR